MTMIRFLLEVVAEYQVVSSSLLSIYIELFVDHNRIFRTIQCEKSWSSGGEKKARKICNIASRFGKFMIPSSSLPKVPKLIEIKLAPIEVSATLWVKGFVFY
jgi:hypothetical protein